MQVLLPTTEYEPHRPHYQELLAAYERAREAFERDPNPHREAVLESGLLSLIDELHRPGMFALGQLLMTPGADETLRAARQIP